MHHRVVVSSLNPFEHDSLDGNLPETGSHQRGRVEPYIVFNEPIICSSIRSMLTSLGPLAIASASSMYFFVCGPRSNQSDLHDVFHHPWVWCDLRIKVQICHKFLRPNTNTNLRTNCNKQKTCSHWKGIFPGSQIRTNCCACASRQRKNDGQMVIPGPVLAMSKKKDGRYLPILGNDCGASAAYVFYDTNMQHTTTPPRIRHCSLTYLGESAQNRKCAFATGCLFSVLSFSCFLRAIRSLGW